jgi:hypothetical protein
MTDIMGQIVDVIREANSLSAHPDEKVPTPA